MKELEINSMKIEDVAIFDFNIPFNKWNIGVLKDDCSVIIHSEIHRIKNRFFIKSDIAFTLQLECSRCLKHFDRNVLEHTDVYFENKRNLKSYDADYKDIDSAIYEYTGSTIDLTQMVYDTIITSIPMKPLCSPNCKGIKLKDKNIDIKLAL
ncbi:MAG: hypothetical protein GWP03_00565 [Proteobacteria bacterium]|nr:hypothetical protein [Pseudomonadota bacterium]